MEGFAGNRKPKKKKKKKKKKHSSKKVRTTSRESHEDANVLSQSSGIISDKIIGMKRKLGKDGNASAAHDRLVKHSRKKSTSSVSSKTQSYPKNSLSSLQSKFLKKLNGAKFRRLNEDLYTKPSDASFLKFQENPQLFFDYHEGFREQVKSWPKNPLDVIINEIRKMQSTKLIIGDFGCGDAVLSQSIQNKVHSFDLVARNDSVTACNIANVPLKNNVLDVAVFCLALMGTDYYKFIIESHRVLKSGGTLLIAEVESRFCHKEPRNTKELLQDNKLKGKQKKNTNILKNGCKAFISMVEKLGFRLIKQYPKTSYFVLFKFEKRRKDSNVNDKIDLRNFKPFPLKACIYKRR